MAERHQLAHEVAGAAIFVDPPLVEVRAEIDVAGVRVGREHENLTNVRQLEALRYEVTLEAAA